MRNRLFEQFLEKKSRTKKWSTVPLSFVVHGMIIVAVIVVPYLDAESQLPELKVIDSIKLIGEPVLPSVMVGKKGSSKKTKINRKKEVEKSKAQAASTNQWVAPVDVPEEIVDEEIDLALEGTGEGIEGGIEGGALDGIDGGLATEFLSTLPQMENFVTTRAQAPKILREVKPIYPAVAMRARIQGTVVVEAVTDVYGRVKTARVITGHPLLNKAALDAVKQWLYQPYIIQGLPKPVRFTVTVNFDLKKK